MRSCSAFWINTTTDSPVVEFFYSCFLVFRSLVLEELVDANELVGEMSASEKP